MCFFSFLFKKKENNQESLEPLIPEDNLIMEKIYNKNKFYPKYTTIFDVIDERINAGLDKTTTVEEYDFFSYQNDLMLKKLKEIKDKKENQKLIESENE